MNAIFKALGIISATAAIAFALVVYPIFAKWGEHRTYAVEHCDDLPKATPAPIAPDDGQGQL